MKIDTSRKNDIGILRIDGNVDFITSGELDTKITEVLEEEGVVNLLLDFSGVPFIASAGLRILLKTALQIKPEGGAIRLCCVNDVVREVIEVSGFDSVFQMLDDETAGLQSFDNQP